MNKRIRKKHKWGYYHKNGRFIYETRKETVRLVVNNWAQFFTISRCGSLKCGYVYKRNIKRAAKWALENDIRRRSRQPYQPYQHLRFARHLQPKENNN